MGIIMKNKVCYSNGGGTLIQPVIYSDTEREVGVWRDGKPLYQRTIYIASLPNNTTATYPHSIDNVDIIFVSNCFILTPENSTSDVMLTNDNFNSMIQYWIERTNIQIWAGLNRSSWSGYFTVQYTKTTDTAGSGTWAPSGVPAVHYSTDEQVVGTWIDGKTLYQKTLTYNSSISLNDSSWTTIPFTGIPSMDYCTVIFMTTDCIFDNRVRLKVDNGDIKGATSQSSGQTVNSITVTIQYTKSTS